MTRRAASALAILALIAVIAVLVLYVTREQPAASPSRTVALSTSPTPTAAAASPTASTQTAVVARRPQGYVLPPECQYIDNGTVDGSATTWKISCPQGLPSNYLRPSLETQGWVSCGTKVWQKASLQIAITDAVNVSGFSGWLDQRPLGGSGCVQVTPPPS
jgi:hypothetical protein